MKAPQSDLAEYIEHININGLDGRMLNVPAENKKAKTLNILFVHGHHSSIERLVGVAKALKGYGNITMPDLPGFGGMAPFQKIGEKPTVDNLADYLASFIKLHYGKKKFIIIGFSFGFLVVTRMLQKYPELHTQVTETVSLGGFVHHRAFKFSKNRMFLYRVGSKFLSFRLPSFIAREVFFRKWFLSLAYTKSYNAKSKFEGLDKYMTKKMVAFETFLWRVNDVPTRYYTANSMLHADIITGCEKLPLNMIHIALSKDQYFDNGKVVEDFKKAYTSVKVYTAKVKVHAPSVMAEAEDVYSFFPPQLRKHMQSLI